MSEERVLVNENSRFQETQNYHLRVTYLSWGCIPRDVEYATSLQLVLLL